jgi:hypothetical protein
LSSQQKFITFYRFRITHDPDPIFRTLVFCSRSVKIKYENKINLDVFYRFRPLSTLFLYHLGLDIKPTLERA